MRHEQIVSRASVFLGAGGVRPPRRSASGQRAVCQPAIAMAEEEDECHRRFQTAVSVVQSLPKHGPYRPSYDAMLRFYGYYKQATCGPCTFGPPAILGPGGPLQVGCVEAAG
ncbi:acyl-CoA-binding domain-containing protein 4 [Erpetoichthys calabaricus]|uniref:acyl-CoA-binding domain-containing protein 4 n=1 Tax=Erpetoichthys calabaricus TaxID=27687 RepID=UPI0022347BE1|nr:acyl-CoA-binding domain-containing protein 4 [Erpetoichthys calabaricus]